MRFFSILFLMIMTCTTLSAQEFTLGLKTGLSLSNIIADVEQDATGMDLEEFRMHTGFHLGITGKYNFTDNFGVRAELIFAQMGTRYKYEGSSLRILTADNDSRLAASGNSKVLLRVTNSYVQIPLMGYARFNKFEVQLGLSVNILVSSRGDGTWDFDGMTSNGTSLLLEQNLDFNYYSDKPGEVNSDEVIRNFTEAGAVYNIVSDVGAYFDRNTDNGSLYNTLDFQLTGGVVYYISRGLSITARGYYSLSDITNTDADIARSALDIGPAFINRDDADRNYTVQLSVGIEF